MLIRKCDICGKELSIWLDVKVTPGACDPRANVYDLFAFAGDKQICEKCATRLKTVVKALKGRKEWSNE